MTATGLARLDDISVDQRSKGMPGDLATTPLAELGQKGWNVLAGDLPLPLAVLRWSAIENNSAWMMKIIARYGVSLCPHGKTTMSPQLFKRQLEDGCWGITLSTPHQVAVARQYGVERIFFANQIVDRQVLGHIARARRADANFSFYHLIDSEAGLEALVETARAEPGAPPFTVLIEMGSVHARTGVRTREGAVALARAIAEHPEAVTLVGLEGFEGSIRGETPEAIVREVETFLGFFVATAEAMDAEGLFAPGEVLLSAGGSAYFDLVAKALSSAKLSGPHRVVLRSGCYLTHDSHMYETHVARAAARSPEIAEAGRPLPALEVWTYLQSRPDAKTGFLTAGRRDVSFDVDLPMPEAFAARGTREIVPLDPAHRVTALNDQHAYLALHEDSPLRIGDRVRLGISHPCTTFDKWDVILVVDDDHNVIDAIKTFF